MAIQDVFAKARARRTIFKRTKPRADLPALVLYMDWVSGDMKRRVKDTDGNEHLIPDKVMQSYYRMVTGTKAKELGDAHWAADIAAAKASVATARNESPA